MLVRVRVSRGAGIERIAAKQGPFASGLSGLVVLLAFSCLMLALWRLTSDLGWTESFVIREGFLSHWQVWMALTILFGALGIRLYRFAQSAALDYFESPAEIFGVSENEGGEPLEPGIT